MNKGPVLKRLDAFRTHLNEISKAGEEENLTYDHCPNARDALMNWEKQLIKFLKSEVSEQEAKKAREARIKITENYSDENLSQFRHAITNYNNYLAWVIDSLAETDEVSDQNTRILALENRIKELETVVASLKQQVKDFQNR